MKSVTEATGMVYECADGEGEEARNDDSEMRARMMEIKK